eukprot:CAMPEP_0168449620 /NCGR_PEP_ID=MMETSP0228-20121227/47695_1 /TAXON_ID=133427 /ORGANISM="Protoceratium reticulatum, Strain CCCM 535 (=CCMP 1889)" /LENGTH=585 /DNA_ID=CAMNT_0008464173 /DNA_START=43 /DNA_END=1800 /DNA_ORIENTATION=-
MPGLSLAPIFLAGVQLLALAASSAAPGRVAMEPEVLPHDPGTSSWLRRDRPAGDELMPLTVAIRVDEDRRAMLERAFWEVSDPRHPNYGQHRSIKEITELLAIPEERVERVRARFLAAGAASAIVAPNRDMISIGMAVSAVEALLETTIHVFGHMHVQGTRVLRASRGYSLPADLAEDVVMVGDLLQFPLLRLPSLQALAKGQGQWPNGCSDPACEGLVTPAVLAQRYKLPEQQQNATPAAVAKNAMAVAEFQGQYFKDSDLQSFGSSCHRDVKVDRVVGGDQPTPGVESELDIEYIKAVAPEIPLTVIYSSTYSLLDWANQISSLSDTPQVHSVSYGNDERQQSSVQYMLTCNTAFMKAGARGISILFASGDQGVCGREGCGVFKFRFKPDFPAGSPYITAVGGTDFASNPPAIGEESAWQSGGGGFSDTFPVPDYQKEAVSAYKSNPDANLPPQAYWNATGRGYPDVAALGGTKTPYCVSSGGEFGGVAGTSASCPVVAGVFARLNSLRLAAGKPPMGFLNPFIYQNPSGFQDVTLGCNKASRNYGFTAVKGWDAATGFGTPNFEALSKLAMAAATGRTAIVV